MNLFQQNAALDSMINQGLQQSQAMGQGLAIADANLQQQNLVMGQRLAIADANTSAQFQNPYANGVGGFIANQAGWDMNFHGALPGLSLQAAMATPNNQPLTGFGGVHLSNAVMGASAAGQGFIGQTQINQGINDGLVRNFNQFMGGVGDVQNPLTGVVFLDAPADQFNVGFFPGAPNTVVNSAFMPGGGFQPGIFV